MVNVHMIEGAWADKVLDHGYIQLVRWMGGDDAIIEAARICYQSQNKATTERNLRLLRRLMHAVPQHNTPFEHAVLTWKVRAPLLVARQWLRHRLCTFNEKSLRYCVADRLYYVPANWPEEVRVKYVTTVEKSFDAYEYFVSQGMRREQARAVLPVCVYTEFMWTVNAWAFMNWLSKRDHPAAQWEHRQYADRASYFFGEVMPITAKVYSEYLRLQKLRSQITLQNLDLVAD